MEKKRQKMTNEYIRSQRTDPTLSPLKMVQTVVQEMHELPPYSNDNPQPTAPLYHDLHSVHHTTSLADDPLHIRNIDHTLQELQIPGFSPDKPLQHNQQKLEIEIDQTQKNLQFFQGMTVKQPELIKHHQKRLNLLRDLQNKLPQFYARTSEPTPSFPYSSGDRTSIFSSINDTLQTSWSTTQHSEAISQPPFSADVLSNPPETKATTSDTKKTKPNSPTTQDTLLIELTQLKINVDKPHKSSERHLKFLQNYITQCYIDIKPSDFNRCREYTEKFIKLTKLQDKVHKRFGEENIQ